MNAESGSASTPRTLVRVRVSALAGEQHGVVARRQLAELGWAQTTIHRRIEEGFLHSVWPGVYALGHRVVTRDGWLMAATLACGEGGHLTARASGAARGLLTHGRLRTSSRRHSAASGYPACELIAPSCERSRPTSSAASR